ncbi:type II toxin-antitoxin system VapC family toxin [Humibacillus xanthopallidus]|uniref:type II toxin-antitoxin system VapC family toxin n=1 Tax=Humibacillus xanthopallidus TaxID=412689 RepID=UPI003850D833
MGRPDRIESALLDASSLLGVVQGEEEFACLKSLLAAVDRGAIKLVESTAILTEVLPHHTRDTEAHRRAREGVRALLESPDTQLVDVNTVVARKAGDLRAEFGLQTWDAIHLATAVVARVNILIVRDHKFPFGDYDGVHISRPFDIDEDKLFS